MKDRSVANTVIFAGDDPDNIVALLAIRGVHVIHENRIMKSLLQEPCSAVALIIGSNLHTEDKDVLDGIASQMMIIDPGDPDHTVKRVLNQINTAKYLHNIVK